MALLVHRDTLNVVMQDEIHVVIIHDEEEVRELLGEAIAAFGYRAFTAANGVQGLREVRERRPQVVLLDRAMPGLDGHSVFECLIRPAPPFSIVIVSASNDEAAARALLQRGAFDYLLKPAGGSRPLAERHHARSSCRLAQLNPRSTEA